MNPRLTDIPLHADGQRGANLPIDYFEPTRPFLERWFHLFLGMCIGAGLMAIVFFSVMVAS